MTRRDTLTKDEKRARILGCAQRIFAERGVVDATMEDIARAAGVSKGALYLLFSSKDDLYLHLATTAARGLLASMLECTQQGNGFERASAILRAYARYYADDATKFRLAFGWLTPGYRINDAIPMAHLYREAIVEIMRMSVKAFELGQSDGSIRTDLPAARTVVQLWGSVVGLLFLRMKRAENGPLPPQVDGSVWSGLASQVEAVTNVDLRDMVDEFIDLVMLGVRATRT
jgi:AcrR family transcriptional regulator